MGLGGEFPDHREQRTNPLTMPDKPSRSVFIPLLIVGVVVAIALFVTVVPTRECDRCTGLGVRIKWPEPEPTDGPQNPVDSSGRVFISCLGCSGKGKLPLLNIWRREAEEGA